MNIDDVIKGYTAMMGCAPADMNSEGPQYWINHPTATIKDMYYSGLLHLQDLVNGVVPAPAPTPVPQPLPANSRIIEMSWPFGLSMLQGGTPEQHMPAGWQYAFHIANMPELPTHQIGIYYGNIPHQISLSRTPFDWSDSLVYHGLGTAGADPFLWINSSGIDSGSGAAMIEAGREYYLNVKHGFNWGEEIMQPSTFRVC